MNIPLSAFVPENLVSRETVSAVPSRVSLLISILLRLNLVLTYYKIPPEFRCRESAGTGPVNLKVVPNECCHT